MSKFTSPFTLESFSHYTKENYTSDFKIPLEVVHVAAKLIM